MKTFAIILALAAVRHAPLHQHKPVDCFWPVRLFYSSVSHPGRFETQPALGTRPPTCYGEDEQQLCRDSCYTDM